MPRRVTTGEGAERAAVRGLSGWVEVRREDVRPVGRVRKEKEEDDLWDPHMSGWGGGKLKELLRFGEWEWRVCWRKPLEMQYNMFRESD